jgi:hypothetical protein
VTLFPIPLALGRYVCTRNVIVTMPKGLLIPGQDRCIYARGCSGTGIGHSAQTRAHSESWLGCSSECKVCHLISLLKNKIKKGATESKRDGRGGVVRSDAGFTIQRSVCVVVPQNCLHKKRISKIIEFSLLI